MRKPRAWIKSFPPKSKNPETWQWTPIPTSHDWEGDGGYTKAYLISSPIPTFRLRSSHRSTSLVTRLIHVCNLYAVPKKNEKGMPFASLTAFHPPRNRRSKPSTQFLEPAVAFWSMYSWKREGRGKGEKEAVSIAKARERSDIPYLDLSWQISEYQYIPPSAASTLSR